MTFVVTILCVKPVAQKRFCEADRKSLPAGSENLHTD